MKKFGCFVLSIITILSQTTFFSNPVYGLEAERIRVAVIDTGISSVAISVENLAEGRNYVLPNNSTEDDMGHGTAVAGIIVGNKKAGVLGLCPTAELVPLVYYSKADTDIAVKGDLPMLAQIIRDAVEIYDCRIINISSGARVDTPTLRDAVAWAEQRGVLVVSSAGNDGDETVYFPGAFPSVLCIGTFNESKDGPAFFSNRYKGLDLLAPGTNLNTVSPKGEAVKVNGTSFSTAWVTGLAASLLTTDPTLTPYQLRQLLCNSAKDICSEGYDVDSGWRIVDMYGTMAQVQENRGKQLPFDDVDKDAYYLNAVNWAFINGVTLGTTSSTFSPDMTCTRAQTVTFLWRAVGCPEPRITKNPFDDVAEDDYFYKSVLWAVERGITLGTSKTTFNPYEVCSEAQVITFLWRALNRPDASGQSELAKGLGEYYYTDAVAWGDTHGLFTAVQMDFVPMREATRANIVVYLYNSTGLN
ncbi:MAG: S8 family serine peptidase [Thermoclostridium sp.]|nr:S8 family serine peptidase [Thermoclostridium sp.]